MLRADTRSVLRRPSTEGRTMPAHLRHPRATGTVALLALALAVGITPARAHDQLIDSSPSPGEHLDVAPEDVTLVFSGDVLDIGAVVRVVDHADTAWTAGDPVLDGPEVVTPLVDDLPDGAYEVRWRVVSDDGHPISGVIPFSVGDAAAAPVPSPATSAAPPASPGDVTADAASSSPSTATRWWRPLLVGTLGALVASALFWSGWLLRRRATHNHPSPLRKDLP